MKITRANRRILTALRYGVLICGAGPMFVSNAFSATLIVNQAHPNASDSGPASDSRPLATIGAAMKRLQPGDHVSIAAGIYREPVLFPARSWAGAAETVIEGDPQGRTWIKGSVIFSAWRSAGTGRFVAQ